MSINCLPKKDTRIDKWSLEVYNSMAEAWNAQFMRWHCIISYVGTQEWVRCWICIHEASFMVSMHSIISILFVMCVWLDVSSFISNALELRGILYRRYPTGLWLTPLCEHFSGTGCASANVPHLGSLWGLKSDMASFLSCLVPLYLLSLVYFVKQNLYILLNKRHVIGTLWTYILLGLNVCCMMIDIQCMNCLDIDVGP